MQSLAIRAFGRMLPIMRVRSFVLTIATVCLGWSCFGQDAHLLDSSTLVHLDRGETKIATLLQPDRAGVSIHHAITHRLGIEAVARSTGPWAMALHAQLVQQQPILHLSLSAGTEGIDILGTLDFGPVVLEAGRHWLGKPSRWGRIEFAPHPQLTMMIGLAASDGSLVPLVGIELSPNGHQTWRVICGLRGDRPTLLVSGVLP